MIMDILAIDIKRKRNGSVSPQKVKIAMGMLHRAIALKWADGREYVQSPTLVTGDYMTIEFVAMPEDAPSDG